MIDKSQMSKEDVFKLEANEEAEKRRYKIPFPDFKIGEEKVVELEVEEVIEESEEVEKVEEIEIVDEDKIEEKPKKKKNK